MKIKGSVILILLLALRSSSAYNTNADTKTLTWDVRTVYAGSAPSGSGEEFANNMKDLVDNGSQDSGYCSAEEPSFPLDNSGLCGSGTNIGWKFNFYFNADKPGTFKLRVGTDFGWGHGAWFNGQFYSSETQDQWWGGSWSHSDVVDIFVHYEEGGNLIELYGAEGCCDGAMDIQYEWFDAIDSTYDCPAYEVCTRMQTKYVDAQPSGSDQEFAENMRELVEAADQPYGYCNVETANFPIDNSNTCGGGQGKNIGFKYEFYWVAELPGTLTLNVGTDFGWGHGSFYNGEFYSAQTSDEWWSGNWDHSDVVDLVVHYESGFNLIELYGAEGCCDGDMDIKYEFVTDHSNQCAVGDLCVDVYTKYVDVQPTGSTLEEFGENLRTAVDNAEQPSGYCFAQQPDFPLNNKGLCGSSTSKNIGWNYIFYWNADTRGTLNLNVGTDFGWGHVAYFNEEFIGADEQDEWWGGNWDHSDVVHLSVDYYPGLNIIQLYGAEGCCDGDMDINFEFIPYAYDDCPVGDFCVDVITKEVTVQPTGADLETFAENLAYAVETASQPSGYCTVEDVAFPVENSVLCSGPDTNIGWRYDFHWTAESAGTLTLAVGTDFGWGHAAYFNGEFNSADTQDEWWGGNWAHSDVLHFSLEFEKGANHFVLYGAEGCCDGQMDIDYSFDFKAECDLITIYQDCDYKGQSQELDGTTDCLAFLPHSICIPEGLGITLYDACWYDGKDATFYESFACINDDLEQLSLLEGQVIITGNKKLLKNNRKNDDAELKFQTFKWK